MSSFRKIFRNIFDIKGLLFSNKTIKQTIFKNTFWLAVAAGVGRTFTFFLFIYIARILGATEYGKLTFALSFIFLFSFLSDAGLSRITTRELSRERGAENEFSALLSLKLFLILGTLIVIFLNSFFITTDPVIRKVIWILAGYVIIGSFVQIIYAFLEARQIMEYEAFAKIFQAVLYVGFGFFIIFNFPSAENLAYGYLIGVLIFLTALLTFFHFKVYPLQFSWNKSIWKKYLSMSWPLALGGLFSGIYGQIDSVMMGHWELIIETGWYNAASRIAKFPITIAILFSQSFFPALSVAFKQTSKKLQRIWNHFTEIMIFLAIPTMVGGLILAPKIIYFIYNESYASSILAFQILILTTVIIIVSIPFGGVLVAANQQKKTLWISLVGVGVNIILNLILIPKYSLYGAASATVITYALLLGLSIKFTSKFTSIKITNYRILQSLIGVFLSGSIMYMVITCSLIYDLHVLYSILIGTLVYLTCFYSYKKMTGVILSQKL